jgi:Carboxypeptidase regulatory-like domain
MRRIGVFALVFLFCLCTATGFAQNATTSLRGVIKDPSGAVVPGATITLSDAATGQKLTATSVGSGEYQLLAIPPAKYLITVIAQGFGNQSKEAELLVNQPATVNFELTVKASTEIVDVTESAQTLNTTDASLGGSADNATIQALPSETRNVPDLLSLQPGVLYLPNSGTDSRNGAVNGGRSDQGNVTLDGVDDNDQVKGYAFTGVLRETQDSVEEFRVATGNTNADAGRSSGAQVSLVTKSGTNKYHGATYEYFRPTNTVSNDFFNKSAQLEAVQFCDSNGGSAATCDPLGNRPPKEIRNIFGIDVGGPIVKDKLFFFANYEGERIAEDPIVVQTTPTAAYKAGSLSYYGDTAANTQDTATQVLDPAVVSALDATVCQVCNGANGSPYTANPGPNPNALAYFAMMPTANGITEGDQLNEGSYTFASPNPISQNTTIVRLDYVPSPKHRIFGRGNLQKDTTAGTVQFPGLPPSYELVDNTKGMTFGDTWTISSNIVNDIRYGYIRQGYGNYGIGTGDYVDFRFLSTATAETRTTIASVPVNNIIDNFNITKGKHNIEIGFNWRLIHQNRNSNASSFNSASTNPYWLGDYPPDPSSLNPTTSVNYPYPDPTCNPSTASACYEPVDGGFENSYLIAYANLVGTVPSVSDQSNYELTSATSGTLLGDGVYLQRHFKANEYEGFVQDAWRIQPNLTMTFGVRYSLLQTPYETKGQEVTPTIDTDAWYKERESAALQGQIYEPDLTFAPAGKFYNKPGLYPKQKDNVAPRFAIVYAPNNKTSIRAGAGIYFDHFGEGLINVYDQQGSFGLSNSVTNPASSEFVEDSPRFIDRRTLPFNNGPVPTQISFPYTPLTTAATDFAITYGIDNKIKTPYTEAFDFSVQRELGAGLTLEANYVGRLGRHLLQSLDLAAPVDYTDPLGGGDYYTASTTLAKIADANGQNAGVSVQPLPYFEDVFPFLANFDYSGESATQTYYSDELTQNRTTYGATEDIADVDFFCYYGCPAGYQPHFWQSQFSSLYSLASIGMSYYNALQLSLHHPMSHGLQFDFNYTFSKSIDMGSDAERVGPNGGSSAILNTWRPYLNRAVSDFDTTHLMTANLVDELPFGKGKAFLSTAGPITNALIGGWQFSGILRFTSGLPFSLFEPGFTTDWQDESYGVVTGHVKAKKYFGAGMVPEYFPNPNVSGGINYGIDNGTPVRIPYAGEAGERNNLRGDGYFDIDSGLSKAWSLPKNGKLKFSWEVYNVSNSVHFDPFSIGSGLTSGNLGVASAELTSPRRMQFALRYDF